MFVFEPIVYNEGLLLYATQSDQLCLETWSVCAQKGFVSFKIIYYTSYFFQSEGPLWGVSKKPHWSAFSRASADVLSLYTWGFSESKTFDKHIFSRNRSGSKSFFYKLQNVDTFFPRFFLVSLGTFKVKEWRWEGSSVTMRLKHFTVTFWIPQNLSRQTSTSSF